MVGLALAVETGAAVAIFTRRPCVAAVARVATAAATVAAATSMTLVVVRVARSTARASAAAVACEVAPIVYLASAFCVFAHAVALVAAGDRA